MPYVPEKEYLALRNLLAFLSGLVGSPVTCARCKNMAIELDCFFPYYTEGNRCSKHMQQD
jgi:hypothetical protein